MKLLSTLSLVLLLFLTSSSMIAPQTQQVNLLVGAWQLQEVNGESIMPTGETVMRIFSPTYTMEASYNVDEKKFNYATGGPYKFNGEITSLITDYDSRSPERVGTAIEVTTEVRGDNAVITGENPDGEVFSMIWERIEEEEESDLAGSWRISERMRQGEMTAMKRGPRKTIKILSGSRFQWAAMNTETKEFMGTGGGTYTFEEGKYTETIEFFSRDSSRVGMSLGFEGEVNGGAWHHSGKSSKGKPISEIWKQE